VTAVTGFAVMNVTGNPVTGDTDPTPPEDETP
jgi:hypothetical protein